MKNNSHFTDPDHPQMSTDSTVRLFQSYPKGFEFYLHNGPPKEIEIRGDFDTMKEVYDRRYEEFLLQQKQTRNAWDTLNKLQCHFREDVICFDKVYSEAKRREERAITTFESTSKAKHEAEGILQDLRKELLELKLEKLVLEKKIDKHDEMLKLMNAVSDAHGYKTGNKNFKEFMVKHATLQSTYRQVFNYVNRGHEAVFQLSYLKDKYKTILVTENESLKNCISKLQSKLQDLTLANNDMHNSLMEHIRKTQLKEAEDVAMQNSIENIIDNFKHFRNYTADRVKHAKTISQKMEAIGLIFTDYSSILKDASEEEHKATLKLKRLRYGSCKSSICSLPGSVKSKTPDEGGDKKSTSTMSQNKSQQSGSDKSDKLSIRKKSTGEKVHFKFNKDTLKRGSR